MTATRRTFLLGVGAVAALPAAASVPRRPRPVWGIGPRNERLIVFVQERFLGPGVPAGTIRSLVQHGPASLAGLVAAFGLHIVPVAERKRRKGFVTSLAVIVQPPKVVALDGQFLLPTLSEALRAEIIAGTPDEPEVDDHLYARVASGIQLPSEDLLAHAGRLAKAAVAAPGGDVVLRILGYAQLGEWMRTPPAGFPLLGR